MDYPESWKKKLATEEEREEIARRHWRPTWRQALLVLGLIAAFAVAFWPRG